MNIQELIPVLQIGIGPAVLISGGGLLLLSMTNRLGRAIDRARILAREMGSASTGERQTRQAQINVISRRARILRSAIVFITISLLLAAIMMIGLFVSALLNLNAAVALVCLFSACLLCLIISLIQFIRDINLSLAALDVELAPFNGEKQA